MNCETCGKPLEARRNDKRFCDSICRSRKWRESDHVLGEDKRLRKVDDVDTTLVASLQSELARKTEQFNEWLFKSVTLEEAVEIFTWYKENKPHVFDTFDHPLDALNLLFFKTKMKIVVEGGTFVIRDATESYE